MSFSETLSRQREESFLRDEENRKLAEEAFGKTRGFTNKIQPLTNRPFCANCGAQYGLKNERVWSQRFGVGETIPNYSGSEFLLSEEIQVGPGMGPNLTPGCLVTRRTWDAVTYHAKAMSDPFCTLRCAHKFALAAHRDGYRRNPPHRAARKTGGNK